MASIQNGMAVMQDEIQEQLAGNTKQLQEEISAFQDGLQQQLASNTKQLQDQMAVTQYEMMAYNSSCKTKLLQ